MQDSTSRSVGSYRWVICALLFLATTINYTDRAVLGVLKTDLQKTIGWNDTEYGLINSAFMVAYAFGSLAAGWMMDRVGVRVGYTIALVVWSLFAAAHALAQNATQFGIVRFGLGIGEAGNFPGSIKAVADWFPKKERALATGIFNSGSNMGAIMAPAVVPLLALHFGWQSAFIVTGLAGLIWVFFWLPVYRQPEDHPRVSAGELAYIRSDPQVPVAAIPWSQLLPFRQTWAFAIAKLLTDPIWWFWLFWFPDFMNSRFKIDLKTIGLPMIAVYVFATFGSVLGGWMSSRLIARGWSVNWARKATMLICAICVVPVIYAPRTENAWTAVLLISVAAAAHQAFSANLFTLTSDMFPKPAIGSVVGIGVFAGGIFGALVQYVAGRLKDETGGHMAMFLFAGFAYLIAILVFHAMVPRLEPVEIGPSASRA